MNKLRIKKTIFSLAFSISMTTYSMDALKSIKDVVLCISEATLYILGTPIISTAQSIQTYTELAIFSSSPKMRALGIKTVQNRRDLIKKNLKQKEKDAINALYVDFKITPEQQETIATITHQYKQFEKEWLASDHEKFHHDPHFPQEIFSILEKNNIKRSAMQLEFSSKDKDNITASVHMLCAKISQCDNFLKIEKVLTSPTITIYPFFYQRLWLNPFHFLFSTNAKKATLIHETGHIKTYHNAKQYFLRTSIMNYSHTNAESILNNENYKQLKIIHEQQAEIFSAIKDSDHASILRLDRQFNNYPQTLHLTHFTQLGAIDDSHHLERHLKARPIPIQKIDTLKTIKFNAPTQPPCLEVLNPHRYYDVD